MELLVVMLIIGLLAAIGLSSFLSQRSKAQDAEAKQVMRTAGHALCLPPWTTTRSMRPSRTSRRSSRRCAAARNLVVNGTVNTFDLAVDSGVGPTPTRSRATPTARCARLHLARQRRLPRRRRTARAALVSGAASLRRRVRVAGRRLHFVGIGGAGMSGLALVARALGANVTGSDRAAGSPYAGTLRAAGIEPAVGHAAENVPEGAEVVVSSAIPADNPERAASRSASCTAPTCWASSRA